MTPDRPTGDRDVDAWVSGRVPSGGVPVEAGRPTILVVVGGEFAGDVVATGRERGVHRLHVRVVEIIARGGAARSGSMGLAGSTGLSVSCRQRCLGRIARRLHAR